MSIIYTFNNKVLKNTANDKWLIKKKGPTFDEVTIGTQTWMAKNLAIDDGGEGITIVDNVTANGVNFGTQYYYTWDAAIRVANSIEGWHLPTLVEWDILTTYLGGLSIGGAKLKSTSGWNEDGNGTDDFGFTVFPVGRYGGSGTVGYLGRRSFFWKSGEYSSTDAYINYFVYTGDDIISSYAGKDEYKLSVRLIKDT